MSPNTKTGNKQVEILIVEDSPTQAERLKYILEMAGYQVSFARNGKEALSLLNVRRPTAVISDIVMPEMDGYQLCRQIKADKDLRSVPVILLTALVDPSDVVKALECGADNFLSKPYQEKYLLSRLQYFLTNQELRKAESIPVGLEIFFQGQKFLINADRLQILNLLISTYEAAVQKNNELTKIQDELRTLNEQLEERVEEKTANLIKEINERKRAEEKVRTLNVELEQRVIERTAQLEATNKELEAFSYSVSHDLRAPLRAIDGFSQMIMEDYSDKLDNEGKRILSVIRSNTKKMGQLIDDLLAFARLGRKEIDLSEINMDRVAKAVFDELKATVPERAIQWNMKTIPPAHGDRSMIQQIFVNLLSNAIKFTRPKEIALIEVEGRGEGNENIYCIRDNGVGFDMQYVGKLFGVFQRLHSSAEFEGTGVGLAIVQRIIYRHGGRVWAEGKVNEGATFYFTLPKGK